MAHRKENINAYRVLVRKPEKENRLLGRLIRRLEENIKIELKKRGWEGMEWIHLAQDRDK